MADTVISSLRATALPTDIAAHGLVAATKQGAPTVLASGNQHLVLTDWRPLAGPIVYRIDGSIQGANLTGMGITVNPDAETLEFALIGAIMILVNVGTAVVSIVADSAASPKNERFSLAGTIDPGAATMFVCADAGGDEKKWFPFLLTSN